MHAPHRVGVDFPSGLSERAAARVQGGGAAARVRGRGGQHARRQPGHAKDLIVRRGKRRETTVRPDRRERQLPKIDIDDAFLHVHVYIRSTCFVR